MKFIVERECIIQPLQRVSSLLGNRSSLPILSNILLQVMEDSLLVTSTDLYIEIIARVSLISDFNLGATTVPARKFYDICRAFPKGAKIAVTLDDQRMLIRSGRSRYALSTLPASNFPNLGYWQSEVELTLPQSMLKRLIEATQFSMAAQDVRYYLNGMLFETEKDEVRTVATDGHRLGLCTHSLGEQLPTHSVIVPRKGVTELVRMLDGSDNIVKLQIGANNIRASIGDYSLTSKLIDGRFPDYRRVLFNHSYTTIEAERDMLKQAFSRAAILSNERFRGVRLYISLNQLKITANNSEQEEAEEIIDIIYQGHEIEIAFNVNYLLDVLNALKCDKVLFLLNREISSMQIIASESKSATYVIMPIRL